MGDVRSEFFKKNESRWADPATQMGTANAGCWNWGVGMFGALMLGVGLPVLLVNISYGMHSLYGGHGQQDPNGTVWLGARLGEMLSLMIIGSIFCSPGVVVLGSAVFSISLADARRGNSWREVLMGACVLGGLLSFLNLPGYLCLELLGNDIGVRVLKVIILFLVAGVAAGAWLARVAWRVVHPQERWIPAFSLTTLLGLVLVWGVIMAVFAPR